jgi:DNA-binding NarL/FixJ family response regulator
MQQASTITEISDQLSLSIKTISPYRTRILEELNLKTNADLARYVVEHHLPE